MSQDADNQSQASSAKSDEKVRVKSSGAPSRSKRRRWPWIILTVVVLLGVLVWSIPYLLSTGPGTALVVGIANGSIKGQLEIDDLSLRWFGDTRVYGLRLKDPDGQEVANVKSLRLSRGTWHLMTDAQRFQRLEIVEPVLTLYMDEQWRPSLAEAVASPEPAATTESGNGGELPKPIGEILVRGGTLTLVSADGRKYVTRKIETSWKLDTLNRIVGDFAAETEGGGQVTASAELNEMVAGNTLDLEKATGRVTIQTPRRVPVDPLVVWVTGERILEVALGINIRAEPGPGLLTGRGTIDWEQAVAYGMEAGAAKVPLDFRDQRLTVEETTVPIAGGTARPACVVELGGEVPVVRMPSKRMVLENVKLDVRSGDEFLGRVNPIFAKPESFSGTMSLETEGVRVPLSPDRLAEATGKGRLLMRDVQFTSGGFLLEILRLRGDISGEPVTVPDGDVPFELRDGRLHYDNLAVQAGADYRLVFAGSVGTDGSLDLSVGVPVTESLLKKVGVKQDVGRFARALEGVRIQVPIVGTHEKPRLAFGQLDMSEMLKKAARGAVENEARNRLEGLLQDLLPRD